MSRFLLELAIAAAMLAVLISLLVVELNAALFSRLERKEKIQYV
jgi:hypothetical protein